MSQVDSKTAVPRRIAGLTLIELMVAMVLGLLVTAGIITVFIQTSKSNKAQTQMARLQESGRFAITRVHDDLRMANAQYCDSTGGIATSDGSVYMDGLRAPVIYANGLGASIPDNTTPYGSNGYPSPPVGKAYAMPSFLFMRGYDCTSNACTSMDPHDLVGAIPDMGTDVDKRVIGADVLTLRYLDSSRGWSIGANDNVESDAAGQLSSITITPDAGEPALGGFTRAMLADCSNAQVFAATVSGGTITPNGTGNGANSNTDIPRVPSDISTMSAPRLFDFDDALQTVTYYLQVVSDGNNGQKTGALMRRVNGKPAEELVRGVERLDFRYGVENADGDTVFLTAKEMDDGGAVSCPQQPPESFTGKGCLWRAVKSIEVSMLVDGQVPLHSLTDNELAYAYPPDGSPDPASPDDASHQIKATDQGFARGMLRRPFTAVVSVRNYNP